MNDTNNTSTKTKVESITLDGSNEYMGGKIYYCNFSPSFSEKPNEVQINVVNEKGSYQQPSINFVTPVKVKIGDLDLKDMYPYKYKNRYSSQGNILEIHFIDPSFVLDKIYIGLNGKHGWMKKIESEMGIMSQKNFVDYIDDINKSSSSSSSDDKKTKTIDITKEDTEKGKPSTSELYEKITENFWILGRQFHPCDENKDNLISFDEAFNVDPCDPCPSCPEDKYENRCKELSYTTIFEVAYSFKDLIDAFKAFKPKQGSTIIDIKIPEGLSADKDKYEKFYRDYFGPLREVLTSWANDFGLNWFYDMVNKQIRFIDISAKEIEVKVDSIISIYKQDRLISYDHEVSAESTKQRGAISWYERGGERKSFTCDKASTVVLSALYGADFLGNRTRKLLNGKKINSNTDCVGAILRAYNPLLRDLFWLTKIYDLSTSKETVKYLTDFSIIANSSSSSSSSSSSLSLDTDFEYVLANNRIIPEYGDMQILAVIDCNLSEADKNKTTLQKIANTMYEDLVESLNHVDKFDFVEKSGFFVLAYIDESALEKRYEMEDELFDFMGKFYTREHLFRLCGMTGNQEFVKNNTSIEAADGSAQIYSKKDGISTNPLSRYKYYKSGYLGCIMGTGNLSTTEPTKDAQKETNQPQEKIQGFQIEKKNLGNNNEVVALRDTPMAYNQQEGIGGTLFSFKKSNEIVPRFEQTAIILEREPQWIPELDVFQQSYNKEISDKFSSFEWKLVGNNGHPPESLWIDTYVRTTQASGAMGKVKLFAVSTGKINVYPAFANEFVTTTNHPTDKTVNQRGAKKLLKRIGGKNSSETPIGLLNNKCHTIGISGINISFNIPLIYTPPHTFVPKSQDNLIEKDALAQTENRGGDVTTSCDKVLSTESFRIPAYRVYVSQSFNQAVTLPKIQTGVYSNMTCSGSVRSIDVLYTKLTDDDFKSFTGYSGYGCIPNMSYLSGMHIAYTGNTFSNVDPDHTLNLEIKGLPKINDYQAEVMKGLEGFNIQISDQGINTSLQYGTKTIKGISSDLLKFQNSRRFDRSARGV